VAETISLIDGIRFNNTPCNQQATAYTEEHMEINHNSDYNSSKWWKSVVQKWM